MSTAQNFERHPASINPSNRPSYGTGFMGLTGLVPSDTGTRWFTRMSLIDVIGSAEDRK